jgi:hypothetical protein
MEEEEDGTWCTVFLEEEGTKVEAKITHTGRGKFKILDDKNDGKYRYKKIDASDIFSCRIDR